MIQKDIKDLLYAINIKQQPKEMSTSLIEDSYFDPVKKRICRYFSVSTWFRKIPSKQTFYSTFDVIAYLASILDDLNKS